MRKVREHIFLGSITDAYCVLQSSQTNITHMLSVFADQSLLSQQLSKPGNFCSLVTMGATAGEGQYVPLTIPTANPTALASPGGAITAFSSPGGEIPALESPGVGTPAHGSPGGFSISQDVVVKQELVRKTVPLRDIESENLLDHLESCLQFIEEAKRSGGNVLVHCLAGISRSASVVTAYLMRTEKLCVNDALASLREVSGSVCPNDGFMEQLRMFEEMGYKVDKENPIYRQSTSAGYSPGLNWLSFLDHVNNAVRGNSLRRSPFMNHVHDVAPPIEGRSSEKGITAKGSAGVPQSRVRIARLWRRSSNPK